MFNVIISGMLIGIANIIPGVSGATLAVLTNQYNRIMSVISTGISLKLKDVDWVYLVVIGASAVLGVFLFSWPLDYGLTYFEGYTISIIIGLIMGSLEGIKLSEQKRSKKERYLNPFFFIGAILVASLILIQPSEAGTGNIDQWKFIASGAIAMVAMIIPGVSGSMMLILLGTYAAIIRLIKDKAIIELIPFMIGVALGGILGIKLVKWVIESYSKPFESFILGAVVGSILFMAMSINFNESNFLIMNVCLVIGIYIARKLVKRDT